MLDCAVGVMVEHRLCERKVDVCVLNAVKNAFSCQSNYSDEGQTLEMSANTFSVHQHANINFSLVQSILSSSGKLECGELRIRNFE